MEDTNLKQMLVEKVENYLNNNDHRYEYDETHSVFRTGGFALKCKLQMSQVMIACRDDGIMFLSSVNTRTDDDTEIQVMEFLTRANYDFLRGRFRMNLDMKTIEFYVFLPCEDVPSYEAIEESFLYGLGAVNQYGDELLAVVHGMKSAKDAYDALNLK